MWKTGIPDGSSFAELAARIGAVPDGRMANGAAAIELVNLIEVAEELGDCVLGLGRSGQINEAAAELLLDRILRCYREPLARSRELAQLKIEVGKLKS